MTQITGISNGANQINLNAEEIKSETDLKALATALGVGDDFLHQLLNGVVVAGDNMTLDELLAKAVNQVPTNDAEAAEVMKKLQEMTSKLGTLDTQIADAEAEKTAAAAAAGSDTAALDQKIKNLKQLKVALGEEIKDAQNKLATALNGSNSIIEDKKAEIGQLINKAVANNNNPNEPSALSGKAQYEPAVNSSGTSTVNTGKAQTGAGTNYDNILGKASTNGIDPGIGADDSILSLYDIQSEQQKRQHMMTLFFYYARMAMSGDVGAMYQFMRFIGYVIAKDKALQNVWMGTKLIELQETSRKATERLLNTEVGESAVEQAEWQKELQKIKSEESIVATSQKLISQMMEEFTQVVETLTNVQKSLLDVNGKILSNLSVWR